MTRLLLSRFTLLILAAAFAAVGIGFNAGFGWATGLWPTSEAWPDRLAQFFVGSVMIAVAISAGYVAWTGDRRAAIPGAVALALIFTGLAVALAVVPWPLARAAFMPHIAAFAVLALLAAALAFASMTAGGVDNRRAPWWVTLTLAVITLVLLLVGFLLVSGRPNTLPWTVQPLNSVLYGTIFLGLAFNYGLGALSGRLVDARASLLGFLVYDLILFLPLARRFVTVPDEQFTSLVVYLAVLALSAIVAVAAFATGGRQARAGGRLPAPSAI